MKKRKAVTLHIKSQPNDFVHFPNYIESDNVLVVHWTNSALLFTQHVRNLKLSWLFSVNRNERSAGRKKFERSKRKGSWMRQQYKCILWNSKLSILNIHTLDQDKRFMWALALSTVKAAKSRAFRCLLFVYSSSLHFTLLNTY